MIVVFEQLTINANRAESLNVNCLSINLSFSNLAKYFNKSETFQVKLCLDNEGFMMKIPLKNRLTKSCLPNDTTPSIEIKVESADLAVLSPLYPIPLWKSRAKNSSTEYTVGDMELICLSAQKHSQFWI